MMSNDHAVLLLQQYQKEYLWKPSYRSFKCWSRYEFKKRVYGQNLIRELILQIRNAPFEVEPIEILSKFKKNMDQVAIHTLNAKTYDFTVLIREEMDNIMNYFWEDMYGQPKQSLVGEYIENYRSSVQTEVSRNPDGHRDLWHDWRWYSGSQRDA